MFSFDDDEDDAVVPPLPTVVRPRVVETMMPPRRPPVIVDVSARPLIRPVHVTSAAAATLPQRRGPPPRDYVTTSCTTVRTLTEPWPPQQQQQQQPQQPPPPQVTTTTTTTTCSTPAEKPRHRRRRRRATSRPRQPSPPPPAVTVITDATTTPPSSFLAPRQFEPDGPWYKVNVSSHRFGLLASTTQDRNGPYATAPPVPPELHFQVRTWQAEQKRAYLEAENRVRLQHVRGLADMVHVPTTTTTTPPPDDSSRRTAPTLLVASTTKTTTKRGINDDRIIVAHRVRSDLGDSIFDYLVRQRGSTSSLNDVWVSSSSSDDMPSSHLIDAYWRTRVIVTQHLGRIECQDEATRAIRDSGLLVDDEDGRVVKDVEVAASSSDPRRRVIKVMRDARAWTREIHFMKRLPNVTPHLYDAWQCRGTHYILAERMDGTLRDSRRRRRNAADDGTLVYTESQVGQMRRLAQALDREHILHGRLTTDNILIKRFHDGVERMVVHDFRHAHAYPLLNKTTTMMMLADDQTRIELPRHFIPHWNELQLMADLALHGEYVWNDRTSRAEPIRWPVPGTLSSSSSSFLYRDLVQLVEDIREAAQEVDADDLVKK